jgi:hypothetical protein
VCERSLFSREVAKLQRASRLRPMMPPAPEHHSCYLRDRIVNRTLRRIGWRVLRVWEHELIRKHEARLLVRLRRGLKFGDQVQVLCLLCLFWQEQHDTESSERTGRRPTTDHGFRGFHGSGIRFPSFRSSTPWEKITVAAPDRD